MTGWEIRQALRVILGHADTTIETGLAWLDPAEADRLEGLLKRMRQQRTRSRRVTDIGLPHEANRQG